MYSNLRAEMARKGITNEMIAKAIGRNEGTTSAKLNHFDRLKLIECFKIRDLYFPTETIDYLFATETKAS